MFSFRWDIFLNCLEDNLMLLLDVVKVSLNVYMFVILSVCLLFKWNYSNDNCSFELYFSMIIWRGKCWNVGTLDNNHSEFFICVSACVLPISLWNHSNILCLCFVIHILDLWAELKVNVYLMIWDIIRKVLKKGL